LYKLYEKEIFSGTALFITFLQDLFYFHFRRICGHDRPDVRKSFGYIKNARLHSDASASEEAGKTAYSVYLRNHCKFTRQTATRHRKISQTPHRPGLYIAFL
jgi:hypothetical protein